MGNWVSRSFNHCKFRFFYRQAHVNVGQKKKEIFQSTDANPICVLASGCAKRRLFWDENAGRSVTCCLDLLDMSPGWGQVPRSYCLGFGTGTAGRERSKGNSKRISLIFAFVSYHGQSYPLGADLGFLKGFG